MTTDFEARCLLTKAEAGELWDSWYRGEWGNITLAEARDSLLIRKTLQAMVSELEYWIAVGKYCQVFHLNIGHEETSWTIRDAWQSWKEAADHFKRLGEES